MERDVVLCFDIVQLLILIFASLPPSPFSLPLPGRPLWSQATTLFQCELFVSVKKKRSRSNLRRLKSLFLLSDMVVTGQEMVKEK